MGQCFLINVYESNTYQFQTPAIISVHTAINTAPKHINTGENCIKTRKKRSTRHSNYWSKKFQIFQDDRLLLDQNENKRDKKQSKTHIRRDETIRN